MEDLVESPSPRHRRSDPTLFFVSALLTVSAGAAVLTVLQLLNRPKAGAPLSMAARLDSQKASFGYGSRAPNVGLQKTDDGSNMIGDARAAVDTMMVDAPANVPARNIPPSPPTGSETAAAGPQSLRSEPAISEEERQALSGLFGKWDSETAIFVGNKPGLLYSVADRLSRYPRLLHFLFNNNWVIQGLLSQAEVQRNCATSRALVGYLTDVSRKQSGVSDALQAMSALEGNPQSLNIFFQSEMAGTMISQCPAMVDTMRDANAMAKIFTMNPRIAKTLSDPTVIRAMNAGAASRQLYQQYLQLQAPPTNR